MCDNIKIVIGSWGSYNECNERALGSKWLDLSDYSDWDEIVEELKKEGFELDGIDEELFIQDVEGIGDRSVNWDYVNPEKLFNTLKESGVLDDDYKYKVFCAFLEVRCYDDFEEKVNSHGDRWDDCINLWSGYSWEDTATVLLKFIKQKGVFTMNITIENKKQKAIELMQKLDIYKPYIKGFKEKTDVCFFECFGGYWAYQEPELMAKIKEFEEQYNVLVYAVTHEYTDFGECYDFLYISDYEEEWDEMLYKQGRTFYAYAYVWNKTDDCCSEFGTIGVCSFGGGIKRVA